MEKIPCPGCRTELDFEVTTCPICLRPRSKYEITRAYANMRAEQAKARKRPFIIAGWLLAVSAAAGAAYHWRAPIGAAAASARARFAKFADDAMDPKRHSNPAMDAPPPPETAGPGAPASAAPPQTAPPAAAAPQAPAVAPKPAGAVMPARAEPVGDLPLTAMDPTYQWALRGRVYDLLTLKPVPNVSFAVKSTMGGMAGGFMADADGRYLTVLPRLQQGGYEIVGAGGIRPVVFYESDIPYKQLSESERREMADNAASGESHASPLTDMIGETAVHRDIFVVPQR